MKASQALIARRTHSSGTMCMLLMLEVVWCCFISETEESLTGEVGAEIEEVEGEEFKGEAEWELLLSTASTVAVVIFT